MKYVDVNVIIYWLVDHPEHGDVATRIMERIESSEKAVTSSLTPWLVSVVLRREAENFDERVLMERLAEIRNLKIASLKMSTYQRAVGLMSRYKLDFEDSIHLATALEYNAGAIYSNDSDFDRCPLKRVFD